MSSNLPDFLAASSSNTGSNCIDWPFREPGPPAREWVISGVLLCITVLSTSFAGTFYHFGDIFQAFREFINTPGSLIYGLPFSIPLISILLAHELGHFLACRYYGMRCTPPFFIPAPVPITGTFGAFIKIKSQFRHKRALFDIGVAGPLAGFAITLPVLIIGINLSSVIPKEDIPRGFYIFGDPIIFQFFSSLILGYSPGTQEIEPHLIAMAGWVGLLATSLNLLPIWQLDGGHIAYAILGKSRQKKLSIVAIVGLFLFGIWGLPSPTYLVFGALLLFIGWRMRFYHPPTLLDEEKPGLARLLVGFMALLILIFSFIPVPVRIS